MIDALPASEAQFSRFSTSPYVLLFFASQQGYSRVSQIEGDIVPAKVFSSMETSAGRMIEAVALPVYGWECVTSEMHSSNSALDGRKLAQNTSCVATLKSGPRCLNDEMSENFADAIISHSAAWANEANTTHVEFTYGALYGTPKQSNKKDWHILRNLYQKVPRQGGSVVVPPADRWSTSFELNDISVDASIRIGWDWWQYLGGTDCPIEVCVALIRACIVPGSMDETDYQYAIQDLRDIVSIDRVHESYNVGLLQRSQLPWLFFIARHFCDALAQA